MHRVAVGVEFDAGLVVEDRIVCGRDDCEVDLSLTFGEAREQVNVYPAFDPELSMCCGVTYIPSEE